VNQRQELFCQGVFVGKTAQLAYIEAGYSNKSASACATRLLANANIQQRLAELNQAATTAKVMSKAERMERLSEIAREDIVGKFGVMRQGNVQAIAELNKMLGDYAPVKTDITSKGEAISLPPQITVFASETKSEVEYLIKAGSQN
jgi:phage terminase small subunit